MIPPPARSTLFPYTTLFRSATVTGASLDYEGSLTISADLAELVGLIPYEKILVSNLNNGQRFETYAIFGKAHEGIIELKERKSTRLNSSHPSISYAVFCLKK